MVSFSFANVPPRRTTEASKKFVDKALPEVALVPAAKAYGVHAEDVQWMQEKAWGVR